MFVDGRVVHFEQVQVQQRGSVLLQLSFPILDALLDRLGAPVLQGKDGSVHTLLKVLHVGVCLESVPDFLTEKTFCKLEDEVHCPREVKKMDVFVSHWQGPLTTAEGLGHLGRGPDGEVTPAHIFLIEDVCEPANLVLLVVEKGLKSHDVGSHQVTDGVFGGVEGRGLGEDYSPAVLVPVGQHEDVAGRHQVRDSLVLPQKTLVRGHGLYLHTYPAVQLLEPGGVLASHRQILLQDLTGLFDVEFLHPQKPKNEVGVESSSADVGLIFYPLSDVCQCFLPLFVCLIELLLSHLLDVLGQGAGVGVLR